MSVMLRQGGWRGKDVQGGGLEKGVLSGGFYSLK